MTTTTRVIEAVWIRVQEQFLNNPMATLTVEQVRERTGTNILICDAVLEALVDSSVVERTGAGYRLATPQRLAA